MNKLSVLTTIIIILLVKAEFGGLILHSIVHSNGKGKYKSNTNIDYDNTFEGIVFDIKRLSYDEGPGLRTTIFLKGCPLNCLWCHNPEGINSEPNLIFYRSKCILCNHCVKICSNSVHSIKNSKHYINWQACVNCGKCTEFCPTTALEIKGRKYSAQEIFNKILEDKIFYTNSGGGVTMSGGEPLYQIFFVKKVFELCKKEGIHTALDTSGFCELEQFKLIIPYTDLFLFDLKHMNSNEHIRLTGKSNEIIHNNLKYLSKEKKDIQIRVPLIPSLNDMDSNIIPTIEFVCSLGIKKITFLPYNNITGSKYNWIGRKYTLERIKPVTAKSLEHIWKIAIEHHLEVQIGR